MLASLLLMLPLHVYIATVRMMAARGTTVACATYRINPVLHHSLSTCHSAPSAGNHTQPITG